MKTEKSERAARLVLSLICFTAYLSFVIAVVASAYNTDPYHFLLA